MQTNPTLAQNAPPLSSKKVLLKTAAMSAFNRICEDWEVTPEEQCKLLNVGLIDMIKLQSAPDHPLAREQLIRIQYLVLLYRYWVRAHGTAKGSRQEVRSPKPEKPFYNRSPLYLMLNEGKKGMEVVYNAIYGVG